MKTLPTSFTDDGRTFNLIEREGDVAIYSYGYGERIIGWEVFKIRKYADKTFSFADKENPGQMKETFSAAHEAVPPASTWGDEGWTYGFNGGFERAYQRYMDIALSTGPSPILGGAPTGKPRGRERNAFELDLSVFTGEFEFNQVRLANMSQDEPMLRNRLRSFLDAGKVQVVREISGGRGKPRKVYSVVK